MVLYDVGVKKQHGLIQKVEQNENELIDMTHYELQKMQNLKNENKILVNGIPVTDKVALKNNDRILFGLNSFFVFKEPNSYSENEFNFDQAFNEAFKFSEGGQIENQFKEYPKIKVVDQYLGIKVEQTKTIENLQKEYEKKILEIELENESAIEEIQNEINHLL